MWHKGLCHCPGCHLDLLSYHPTPAHYVSATLISFLFFDYVEQSLSHLLFLLLRNTLPSTLCTVQPHLFFWRLFDQCLLSEKPSETICLNVLSTLAPAFSIPMNCFIFICNTYHHFPLYYTYLSVRILCPLNKRKDFILFIAVLILTKLVHDFFFNANNRSVLATTWKAASYLFIIRINLGSVNSTEVSSNKEDDSQ